MHLISFWLVVFAAAYCMALGIALLFYANSASRFLMGFAASPYRHYFEMVARLLTGWAFVAQSARMLFPQIFALFGWVLILTTAALCLVPWQLHRRFALWAVPMAIAKPGLIGVASLLLGAMVVAALVCGRA